MDTILPVWAQPHPYYLLDDRQREVFTFGLVLTQLHLLGQADGVRSVGARFGYEWLPGLSAGVQHETETTLPESDLEPFLRNEHGILGIKHLVLEKLGDPSSLEPPDEILQSFADSDGALIRGWSLNAFSGLDARLAGWARDRKQIPSGYQQAAAQRLDQTKMPHQLKAVKSVDGRRWARTYTNLYQRVVLEFEDLALRRPRPQICPLCNGVYVPLRSRQTVCGNQIWDARTSRLVRRCTSPSDAAVYTAAAAADYRKRRKTKWAVMNRTRNNYGHDDARTQNAIGQWEAWKAANPPPRPPGRPTTQPKADPGPAYTPE